MESGKGRFLCRRYDLRVIPHQDSVDKLVLHLRGFCFGGTVIADTQGRPVIKADINIAGPAPFAGTG
jgi:hypothetical protein